MPFSVASPIADGALRRAAREIAAATRKVPGNEWTGRRRRRRQSPDRGIAETEARLQSSGPEKTREPRYLTAEPRSIYLLRGPSLTEWKHNGPGVNSLRYSIISRNGLEEASQAFRWRRSSPAASKASLVEPYTTQPPLDVTERARTIVAEHLVVDPDQVVNDASFIDDLGADSLDMVELAIKFEQEFGFISDDAVECIVTVGDAVKFLESNAFT